MVDTIRVSKKYRFKEMRPGDTFKLDPGDVRSAQKMAWYYRKRCKRPLPIVIVKRSDGYHCWRLE